MPSVFAALDAIMLDTSQRLFGETENATLIPMARTSGPNGMLSADPSRAAVTLPIIRSEWSGQVETGDNGMGRSSGAFRLGANSTRHIATVALSDCPYVPAKDDEIVYAGSPQRFRIAEVMPDGGAGFRMTLNAI